MNPEDPSHSPVPAPLAVERDREPTERVSRLPWYLQRRWVFSMALAITMHLPLTPAGSFFRLATALIFPDKTPPAEQPAKPPEQDPSLPFEMVEMPEEQKEAENAVELPPSQMGGIMGTPPAPTPQKKIEPVEKEKPQPVKKEAKKSEPKAPKEEAGATAKLASGGDGTTEVDDDSSGDGDAMVAAKKGPVGLRGQTKDHTIGKPDASLVMWFEPWRQSPTRTALQGLFSCNPLWKPFIAEGLTPLDDLDGVMMSTSNVGDPAAATYAVKYNVEASKVDAALESLFKKSGPYGKRLDAKASQLALWGRYVVAFTHPRDMLFLTPTKGWSDIFLVKEPLSLPPSRGRALSFSLENPSVAMKTLGAKIPSRIKELKVDVSANYDTTIDLSIDFEDASEEAAQADAAEVTTIVRQFVFDTLQAAKIAGMAARVEGEEIKAPNLSFTASGTHLSDTVKLPAAQASTLMKTLGYFACSSKKK
ncbi:MAG: hypothetical protein U0165_15725 [Polyangiaceae bacterium]